MKVEQIGVLKETSWNRHQYRVYSPCGLAPCLNTCGGGGLEIKIMEKQRIKQIGRGYNKGGVHDVCPTITSNSFEHNNFVVGSMQKNAYVGTTKGISPTVTAACGMGGGQTPMVGDDERLRKITPRECFRLMGVDDADIDKIQLYPFGHDIKYPSYSYEERLAGMSDEEKRILMRKGISNTQQYKLAGNSIVVDVLYHIFRKMFVDKGNDDLQMTIFDV